MKTPPSDDKDDKDTDKNKDTDPGDKPPKDNGDKSRRLVPLPQTGDGGMIAVSALGLLLVVLGLCISRRSSR